MCCKLVLARLIPDEEAEESRGVANDSSGTRFLVLTAL